jgi:hypothetical protein
LANGGAPPGNDTKLVNGVTPLANGKIGQRSGTVRYGCLTPGFCPTYQDRFPGGFR